MSKPPEGEGAAAWILYDEAGSPLHDLAGALQAHVSSRYRLSLTPRGSAAERPGGLGASWREAAVALGYRAVGPPGERSRPVGRLTRLARRGGAWLFRAIEADGRARRRTWLGPPLAAVVRGLRSGSSGPVLRPDLSAELTVFVLTVGAPSFEACRALLDRQDCTFTLRVVDHVAPMSAAGQRMLDECTTPYAVQVDEDMLLFPHAVRTLHEAISRAPADVAMAVATLYDVHLDNRIQGVKIFRHAVAARYPFTETLSMDVERQARLQADGHTIRHLPEILGLHGAFWTASSIFARYVTVERKYRSPGTEEQWFEPYHRRLLERFLDDPRDLHFFALMGVLAGVFVHGRGMTDERDYRVDDARLGFDTVRRLLEAWRPAGSRR